MARITKKAEILDRLHSLVENEKEAALAQTNVSGDPGKDTKITSISDETETTDQNAVGPEKLNGEQGYKQEGSKDSSEPSKGKSASVDVEKFATDMFNMIQTKLALAQTNVSGDPGKDTKITSISESTETTDQNAVGPEKLNGEQGYKQDASKDESEPSKAQKQASYNLGVAFCDALMKKAAEIKQASVEQEEAALLKEAGRRDLDTIIAQAAAELEAKKAEEIQIKLAEDQGALAFDNIYKQAQLEAAFEKIAELSNRVAQFETLEQEVKVKQAEEAQQLGMSKLAQMVADEIRRGLAAEAGK
jgi:hypothetical protein